MERSPLDDLIVPQPPYRMARPVVMLAAVNDELPPVPAAETPPVAKVPEQNFSLAEAIEQQEAAVEAAAQAERDRLAAAPPIEGALPDENAKDAESRQEAAFQVDVAAAEGEAAVRRTGPAEPAKPKPDYSILDGLEKDRTPEQRAADNALAEQLRQKARAEAGADAAAREEQRQAAARAGTGDVSVKERVSQASKDALAKLNEFRRQQESGAKPDEVAAAAGAARVSEDNLAAAKRGERPAEDQTTRVNAQAEVYADSVKRARENAEARRTEVMATEPKIGAVVPEKGTVVGYDPAGKAMYEVKQPREVNVGKLKPADQPVPPQEVGLQSSAKEPGSQTVRETPKAKKAREAAQATSQDQRDQERATGEGMPDVTIDQVTPSGRIYASRRKRAAPESTAPAAVAEELPMVEAEPVEGEVVPGKGKVTGYEPSGKAIFEAAEPQSESEPDFSNAKSWDELYDGLNALADKEGNWGWQLLIPKIEDVRDRAQEIPADQISAELGVFPASMRTAIERLLAAERQQNEQAPAEAVAAEAAPSAPPENPVPNEREQRLQEENERLRAEMEQLRQQAPGAAPEAETGEAGRSPSRDFSEVANKILAEKENPGFFSQQWLNLRAIGHNAGRFWNSVWAKRNKDLVAERQARLVELEKEAEAFAGKSWKHTAAAGVLFGPRIDWYKSGIERASVALEKREDKRKRHEDARADLLNLMVVREAVPLKSIEKEADAAADRAKKYDGKIEGYYADHRKATEEYVALDDPAEKAEKIEDIKKFERLIQTALRFRSAAQKNFAEKNGQSADMQAGHNVLLRSIERPQQPKTAYGPRRKEQPRKKPKAAEPQAA